MKQSTRKLMKYLKGGYREHRKKIGLNESRSELAAVHRKMNSHIGHRTRRGILKESANRK